MIEFTKTHNIPHEICGKLIVATSEAELPAMDKLFQNGQQNGVEGIERIGPDRIKEIEPFVTGIAALRPVRGIIDLREGGAEARGSDRAGRRPQPVLVSHRRSWLRQRFLLRTSASRGPSAPAT
jgi:hypothetical protein